MRKQYIALTIPSRIMRAVYCFFMVRFPPVSIGISNEIDAHCRILIADTAHCFMFFICRIIIVRVERQMEFTIAQIIWPLHILQPCQLQKKISFFASHVDNDKRTVLCFLPAHFPEPQGFLIKCHGFLQIKYVVVFMNHFEVHTFLLDFKCNDEKVFAFIIMGIIPYSGK